jgi:hypothetical protein
MSAKPKPARSNTPKEKKNSEKALITEADSSH